jgi:transposase InsO family protein
MVIKPRTIILTLKQNNRDIRLTASLLGIHRSTVYRWKKKATRNSRGDLSSNLLFRKSTKPHHIKGHSISPPQLARIITLRKQTGWTAEKITSELKLPVCSLTVHRYLTKHHLVRKYGYHRRPRFQNTLHMHLKNTKTIGYLQFDVKYITPELSGLPYTCFEYAVIDIFSRYKEAAILNHLDQDGSMSAILEILPRLPFKPLFIQTDNGLEFQGRFHKMCTDMNLKHHLIHKSTPNENAVIERSFRTDEEEFFFRLDKRPDHYDQLRDWFSTYLTKYNTYRPHLGINLKTPIQVVKEQLVVANVC